MRFPNRRSQKPVETKELTAYQLHLAKKIPDLVLNPMGRHEFLQFRSICIELLVSNRPWFSKVIRNMAIGSKLTGDRKDLEYLWDHSAEFNLTVLFAMVAKNNGINLGEVEKSDLEAAFAGMSSHMKNKEHVTFIVDLCAKLK